MPMEIAEISGHIEAHKSGRCSVLIQVDNLSAQHARELLERTHPLILEAAISVCTNDGANPYRVESKDGGK